MKSHYPPFLESKIYTTIWNLVENMCDLFILSSNIALFGSSIVGVIFFNDQMSLILFYFYLAVILLMIFFKICQKYRLIEKIVEFIK